MIEVTADKYEIRHIFDKVNEQEFCIIQMKTLIESCSNYKLT